MAKYVQQKNLSGELYKRTVTVVLNSFDSHDALETFVSERFGIEVVNSINWFDPLEHLVFEMIGSANRQGYFGDILTALTEEQPQNTDAPALLADLVKKGILAAA